MRASKRALVLLHVSSRKDKCASAPAVSYKESHTASSASEDRKSRFKQFAKEYGPAILATAPLSILYTASDIPIKTTEGVALLKLQDKFKPPALPGKGVKTVPTTKPIKVPVANKIFSPKITPASMVATVKDQLKKTAPLYRPALRRSLSGAAGSMAIGAFTMPIHTIAVKKMSSEDPAERRRGAALLMGQGIVFSGIRTGGESVGEAVKGAKLPQVLNKYRGKMMGAAMIGLPILYLKRRGVADQMRREGKMAPPKNDRDAMIRKIEGVIKPALVTGGVGAGVGAVESVAEHLGKVPKGQRSNVAKSLVSRSGLRLMAPKALAYGVTGIAGGVVSKLILDRAVDTMKGKLTSIDK
jgi:hypothetical protein